MCWHCSLRIKLRSACVWNDLAKNYFRSILRGRNRKNSRRETCMIEFFLKGIWEGACCLNLVKPFRYSKICCNKGIFFKRVVYSFSSICFPLFKPRVLRLFILDGLIFSVFIFFFFFFSFIWFCATDFVIFFLFLFLGLSFSLSWQSFL